MELQLRSEFEACDIANIGLITVLTAILTGRQGVKKFVVFIWGSDVK